MVVADEVQVQSVTAPNMILYDGWPDSYQERIALKPNCTHALSYCNTWMLSLGECGNGMT